MTLPGVSFFESLNTPHSPDLPDFLDDSIQMVRVLDVQNECAVKHALLRINIDAADIRIQVR
jgi:hypothetical protein